MLDYVFKNHASENKNGKRCSGYFDRSDVAFAFRLCGT
jgi:hypothetical protein